MRNLLSSLEDASGTSRGSKGRWTHPPRDTEHAQTSGIHDLRHTCASLLAAAGATPEAVQIHLGHSSITVTMDRYTHLFPSGVEALIGRLEDSRARNLAAQPPPSERSQGTDIGGR